MSENIDTLIDLFLLDQSAMTPTQLQTLRDWILADPTHAQRFLKAALLHRKIHDHLVMTDTARQTIITDELFKYNSRTTDQELFELMRMEELAPGVPTPVKPIPIEEKPAPAPIPNTTARLPRFWILLAATSMSVLLVILLAALILPPRPYVVATLTDTYQTRWANMETPLKTGDPLLNDHQPKQLLDGFAELEFENGATVVLEGPALFSILDANHMSVSYGQLSARVPPPATGFRIDTSGWKIIDIGTEFGVHAGTDGQTSVHMFNGKAKMQAHTPEDTTAVPPPGHMLEEGQARAADASGHIEEVPLEQAQFVRQFSANGLFWRGQRINLADIVGGGNGFGTGQLCWGLDNKTGHPITAATAEEEPAAYGYNPVPAYPFVDGVFVPDPHSKAVQVSSSGHRFTNCPHNGGLSRVGIFNGHRQGETPRHLKGLGEQTRPYIDIHSSQGITFDLKAIRGLLRSLHRTMNLSRFTAHVGIAEEALELVALKEEKNPKADISILVDGKPRFQKSGLQPDQPATPVDITLQPEDHFLTILVTDHNRNTSWDWVLVVDPMLDVTY